MLGLLGIVFSVLTLYKQFNINVATGDRSGGPQLDARVVAQTVNAYFSGPANMAAGLDLTQRDSGGAGVHLLFNDLVSNVAGLSALADRADSTNRQFNLLLYGVTDIFDQIVPLSIQSYIHFGPAGACLVLALTTWLMLRFDRRLLIEVRMERVYAYAIVVPYLAMGMMLSFGSIYPQFTNFLLPLLVVFWADSLVSGSRREGRKPLRA